MNILYIKSLLMGILLKIIPSISYKDTVNTQITIYNRLKRKFPRASENDLLNSLIMSRIKAIPRVDSLSREYDYYVSFLKKSNKNLQEVIWEIINYENFETRKQKVYNKFSRMNFSEKSIPTMIDQWEGDCKKYIDKRIKQKVK